jgi:hypothetical protein
MSRRTLWILGTGLFLGFGIAQLGALGEMSDHGTGVLAWEFVGTPAKAREILAGWGDAGQDAARLQLLLDYGYLLGYGLLLWLAGTAVGSRRLAIIGVAGACFDALENAALLLVLDGHTGQPWPLIATTAASAKFACIAVALVGIATQWLRRRARG